MPTGFAINLDDLTAEIFKIAPKMILDIKPDAGYSLFFWLENGGRREIAAKPSPDKRARKRSRPSRRGRPRASHRGAREGGEWRHDSLGRTL